MHFTKLEERSPSHYYVLSMVSLIFILVLEPLYSESLFDLSLDYIVRIQEDATESKKKIWLLYSNVGLFCVVMAPFLTSFLKFDERVRAFYYVVMLTSMLFIMNVFKLWYH